MGDAAELADDGQAVRDSGAPCRRSLHPASRETHNDNLGLWIRALGTKSAEPTWPSPRDDDCMIRNSEMLTW
jgi:hypothetical protein